MESSQAAVPDAAGQAPQAAPPLDDAIVVHPHFYEPPSKPMTRVDFGKQMLKYVGSGDKAAAKAFAAQLDAARGTLQSALGSTTVSEDSVQSALNDYLALLHGLVDAPGGAAAGADPAAADGSGAAAPAVVAEGLRGNSPMRRAVSFAWADALVTGALHTYPDALFELGSVLVAAAVWYMRRAAGMCKDTASGIATGPATQANKLLRQAAGLLDYAATWVLPLLPPGIADDCWPQVVKGLSLLALGDCQLLAVLRAIQKGNQPSLIASIAQDTANLYGSALQSVLSCPVPVVASSKVASYLRYKQASLQAYAHCFAGLAQWKGGQAGAGLRCLQEAQAASDAAKKASADFDKAQPATLNMAHRRYDEILQAVIADSKLRIEKENAVVFLQSVPEELPEAPAPKRLVAPAPFALPALAPSTREGVQSFAGAPAAVAVEMQPPLAQGMSAGAAPPAAAEAPPGPKEQDQQQQQVAEGCCTCGCCCWTRWLVFLIAMPLVIMISAVGILVWVVLLPFKLICCPCGCFVQMLANIVEYLIKAPLRLVMWITGKPWDAGKKAATGDAAV